MKMSDTDLELLARYTRQHAEDAFAELVRRHVDLVHSTALRQVRSSQLAEEVAQATFIKLARLAPQLAPDTILSAWLYQVTRREAIDVVRREARRQLREKIAIEMNALINTPAGWTCIEPLLDEAMAMLDNKDRAAVLLRYFENKTLREVGDALGTSDDAAQKRVSRSLERMREFFAKRGVTLEASGLAAVISSNAVQAAPVGLAYTISTSALAGTNIATVSTVGILAFMTSVKIIVTLSALAVALFIGVATIHFNNVSFKRSQAMALMESKPGKPVDTATKSRFLGKQGTQGQVAVNAETDPALAAALVRLHDVVYDPQRRSKNSRSRVIPDPSIKEAIAAFNGNHAAAIALLRQALQDSNAEVRGRAAVGLGLIGPDAKEAVADMVRVLLDQKSSVSDVQFTWSLSQMGPMPESVPDLIPVLQGNPGMNAMMADCILSMAGRDPELINQIMRPLLEDSNLQIRETAAYALASVLKNQAGSEVVRVVIESLKSSQLNSQHLGLAALQNVGRDPNDPTKHLTMNNLGSFAGEAVVALTDLANNSKLEDRRKRALEMLDELDPELRKQNPDVDVWLKNQDETSAFTRRVLNGQATVPEIIEGLNQYPKAAPTAAEALARLGSGASAALPALRQVLAGFQPAPGASELDSSAAYDAREKIANAIQRIAPDLPKPIFTKEDIRSVFGILDGIQPDTARMQAILSALQPLFSEQPKRKNELTPDEMRLVLDTVKSVDPKGYDALAAQVRKIDPKFFSAP